MGGIRANGVVFMLNLESETGADWVRQNEPHVNTLLLDHAHCEKKAASTAINLIFRYQIRPEFMRPLSELAREELEHFELMLDVLRDRDIEFEPLHPSEYAGRLYKLIRRGEPHRLFDTLLICSLIEARSCDRMKAMSLHLEDADLRKLYRDLLECEARHHHCYVEMAGSIYGREETRVRLKELALAEAEIVLQGDPVPRMHG